ncbi:alpha/beta fold hydrolase [Nocardia sp. NPDC047654]|uniref:alpha/beta fold hydrolase n=1 Tax=Nocardia sp. NPDC047654 TaxID=3364314 RepID=UPI0037114AC2
MVAGTRLRYGITGAASEFTVPTLLLVHGAGAHRRWWDLVVPDLSTDHRVITLDLSGHGDSAWRDTYGPTVYGQEIRAAARLADGPVVLVGHSMGGRAAVVAAATAGKEIHGTVLLDSLFPVPGDRPERPDSDRRTGSYADEETARDRFRLLPVQPRPSAAELRGIADYALTRRGGRWCWKFDPQALWRFEDDIVDTALRRLACPVTYVYGELSRVPSAAAARRLAEILPTAVITAVPDGHHHLPLDSPQAVIEAVRSTATRVQEKIRSAEPVPRQEEGPTDA